MLPNNLLENISRVFRETVARPDPQSEKNYWVPDQASKTVYVSPINPPC